METLFGLFFFTLYTRVLSADICKPSSCSNTGPQVRFPFRLNDQLPERCGYPGFDLSCNGMSQLVLTLPLAGEFVVNYIDYASQAIFIKPDFCHPNRIQSFSLSDSPYTASFSRSYTFFNCSSNWSQIIYPAESLDCLGGNDSRVIAMPSYLDYHDLKSMCRNISTVEFPVQWASTVLQEDFQLIWGAPFCTICEIEGGHCGFKSEAMMEIGCSKPPRHGLANSAKYGIIIGAGIPGLVFLICLASYTFRKIKACYNHRRGQWIANLTATTIAPQPAALVMGLDKLTIESYPKTVLGESKRLPKPNDSTCPICLSDYQPKDTLRTVPECNHYFHVSCIDEWLRLNATCPVCRNSPGESSVIETPTSVPSMVVTTTSSMSSSTS